MKSYSIMLRDIRPFVFVTLTGLVVGAVLSPSDAWASKLPIVIGDIQPNPDTPACVIDCEIEFSVYACDPEKDCDPAPGDQGENNEVRLDWQIDGGGWVDEQEGCQAFNHSENFSTVGEHTIQARARESESPTYDCDEEDEDEKTTQKVICLYALYAALVNGETTGVEVDCGESVHISADVDGDCDDITLFYYLTCEGEFIEVYEAGSEGCDFTPKPAGTWELEVWPENDCDCGSVFADFEVKPTCEENCCGPEDREQVPSFTAGCQCDPPEPCAGVVWTPAPTPACGDELLIECVGGNYFATKLNGAEVSCCIFGGGTCTDGNPLVGLNNWKFFYDENGRLVRIWHKNWEGCAKWVLTPTPHWEYYDEPGGKAKIVNLELCPEPTPVVTCVNYPPGTPCVPCW